MVFGSQRLEVGAHHESIHAIGHVVALSKVDLLEAERPIQANRARVIGANLEKHLVRTLGCRLAHQGAHQRATNAAAALKLVDGDGLDVTLPGARNHANAAVAD